MDTYGEKISQLSGAAWRNILDYTARSFEQQDNFSMLATLSSFLNKWDNDGIEAWSYLTGSGNIDNYVDELRNCKLWEADTLHSSIVGEIDYLVGIMPNDDDLYKEMQDSLVWYWNDATGSYHMTDNQKEAFNDLFAYLTHHETDFYSLVDANLSV